MLVCILAVAAAVGTVLVAAWLFPRFHTDTGHAALEGEIARHSGSMLSALFLHVGVLVAGAVAGLGIAAPAPAGAPARAATMPATVVGRPDVAPGRLLCVDLDIAVIVRLRLAIGACRPGARPPQPPRPTPTRTPVPPRPPKPAPPGPWPPRPAPPPRAAPVIPRDTSPPLARRRAPEPTPSATRPSRIPATVTPTGRMRPPRTEPPPRRRNPLSTVIVMVVLTAVIASGASVAFAARR